MRHVTVILLHRGDDLVLACWLDDLVHRVRNDVPDVDASGGAEHVYYLAGVWRRAHDRDQGCGKLVLLGHHRADAFGCPHGCGVEVVGVGGPRRWGCDTSGALFALSVGVVSWKKWGERRD